MTPPPAPAGTAPTATPSTEKTSEISAPAGTQTRPAPDIPATPEPPGPVGATSKPKTAEELHGARPVIGGRLQWSAPETTEASISEEAAAPPAPVEPWRPTPMPAPPVARPGAAARAVRYVIHLLIALLSGAIVLAVVTAVAAGVSDARVAILEMRGLPIFIGGAVSIVIFVLLRTSAAERAEPGARRTGTVVGVLAGLAILVIAAALFYQPAWASKVQPRIERALRLYGTEDKAAVDGFQDDIAEWNQAAQDYYELLQNFIREQNDPAAFQRMASESERTLDSVVNQMETHAQRAKHGPLADGLEDLASVYEDQVGGLRLLNRGLIAQNIDVVRSGDRRFKEAQNRATTLFDVRLGRLLEDGGFDSEAFGRTLKGADFG